MKTEDKKSQKPNNPPAFPDPMRGSPQSIFNQEPRAEEPGMTLRDYFAAKAMQGNLAACNPGFIDKDIANIIAETCYKMADAMLKQREI